MLCAIDFGMAIASVDGYRITPFAVDHLEDLFTLFTAIPTSISFFTDSNYLALSSRKNFREWVRTRWNDAVVGLNSKDRVIAVSYLTALAPNHMANIHTAFLPGFWKPPLTQAMAHEVMAYFFEHWNLVKLQGYVDQDNRLSRLFTLRIGMKYGGEVRAFAKKNGIWKDYNIYSILREELNGG